MIDKMTQLVREMDICVLATLKDGRPYCSLMAYAPDKEGRRVYMITDRNSTKFKNISADPHVSLLIDTREKHGKEGRRQTLALTASGIARVVKDRQERSCALKDLVSRHGQLEGLALSPSSEVIGVDISSMLLLEGIEKSYFEEIGPE